MNISAIPASYDSYAAFLDDFERTHFRYSTEGAQLMEATKGLVAALLRPLVSGRLRDRRRRHRP